MQRGDDDLADLAVGHRVVGARAHDLHQHALVHHQPLARRRLVGNDAELGRRVGLVAGHAALGQPVAQAWREGLAAEQRLPQPRQRHAELGGLLQQDAQEAGGAHVGVGLQVLHGLQLLLGVAGAAREHAAAQRQRAAFQDPGPGGEVVAEAVVHQVAGLEAGGLQGAGAAPVVGTVAFGFVDGAGRLVDAPRPAHRARGAPADGAEAAEGIVRAAGTGLARGLLALQQRVLARDGHARQRGAVGHGVGVDAGQRGGQRRLGRSGAQLRGQGGHESGLALGGVAQGQGVDVGGVHDSPSPVCRCVVSRAEGHRRPAIAQSSPDSQRARRLFSSSIHLR